MQFTTHLTPAEEGGYVVTFPDVPEAITQGDTEEEALRNGLDALITALDFYFEDRRPVPLPSHGKQGGHTVQLPSSVVAKVLLLNEMIAANVRSSELATRMGVTKQEVTRLLDLHHSTKIDALSKAMQATGKNLVLSVG